MALKTVRVFAGPTGPTGTMEGVRIFANITGPSGLFAKWSQIGNDTGPTGRFQHVYPVTAPNYAAAKTGTIKTVIIQGFTGPS